MTLTATEKQLAIKLAKAKSPRKALTKAVGDDVTDVLWRMLAAGAVTFRGELADAAGCCAEKAKLADVWAAVKRLDETALREESVTWALDKSYREHANEWERELPKLPPIASDLVAGARHVAGIEIPVTQRERVLETLATAAADKAHTYHHLLWQDAEKLGESRADFGRRVLGHLAEMPADARFVNCHDVIDALAVAPWETVAKLLATVPDSDRDDSDVLEMLATRTDSAAQLVDAFTREEAFPRRLAGFLLVRAVANGETPPEALDAVLVEWLASGIDDPDVTAAIETLPEPRLKKLVKALKATKTTEYSCAGLLRDKKLDAAIVSELVDGVISQIADDDAGAAESTLTSTLWNLVGAGAHGIELADRALAKLEDHAGYKTWYWSAHMRLLVRRAQFMMSRGRTPRRIDLVLPGPDLVFTTDVRDAVGHIDEPLQGLTPAERTSILDAWRPYDWDDTLALDQVFGDQPPPPDVSTRPWTELVDMIAVTAFHRLADDDKVLPLVFARPEELAAKLALAERLATRANHYPDASPVLRGMANVLAALLPIVHNAVPLTGELEQVAKRLLADEPSDEVRDFLLALPLDQVTAWLDEMRASGSTKIKRLATAYAKRLPA